MERSDFLTRLIGAIIFFAIAIYIGIYIYQSQSDPFQTTVAVRSTIGDSVEVQGYVVRDEEALSGGAGTVVLASDGKMAARGETVAVEYSGSDAMASAARIRELEVEISQAEAAEKNAAAASDAVMELSKAVNSGSFDDIYTAALGVRTSVLSGDGRLTDSELQEKQAELSGLKAAVSAGTDVITAPASGIFTSVTDGLEGVSPEDVQDLTPSALDALFENASGTGIGKMVYGVYWYYAAEMDSDAASCLAVGGSEKLRFESCGVTASMTVKSIGPDENGKRVVLFSCSRYLSEFTDMRQTEAELVTEDYTGIRVPKKAIHLDEEDPGVTYIYVVSGSQAERVDVEIIGELSDNYLVSDSGELRENAEIIVKANDLYDGKVVR